MEFVHRIGLNPDERDLDELAGYGILVNAGFNAFDITESDERWPTLQAWVARRRPSDIVRTQFTEAEVAAADWLEVLPDWHSGYPLPKDDFGYRQVTYDVSEFCEACGVGLRQVNPFRMKGEPRWGQRGVLQLNWVFDEYFVKPEIWDTVFRNLGVEAMPVLDVQGHPLATVVQLVIRERVHVGVDNIPAAVCGDCGRVKYRVVTRGPSRGPAEQPQGHLVRSKEWFGDGASGANEVIASQSLHRIFRGHQVRGISFAPTTSADRMASGEDR